MSLPRSIVGLVLTLLLATTVAAVRGAEDESKRTANKAPRKAKPARRSPKEIVTPSREAAALAFVEEHHPELRKILKQLQGMQPDRYEEAIADLFATSEQLAELKARDAERYELTLEQWKVQSRIGLLAAKMTRNSSESLKKELEKLLNEQIDLRIRQHRQEAQRLEKRIQRSQELAQKLESDREKLVNAQMRRFIQTKPKTSAATSKEETSEKEKTR